MTKFDISQRTSFITEVPASANGSAVALAEERSGSPAAPGPRMSDWPLLPWPRGPLSAAVITALQRPPGTLGVTPPVSSDDPLGDDDLQLALYLCYEVHYHGYADSDWEWDLGLLGFRAELERVFLDGLRSEIGPIEPVFPFEVATAMDRLIQSSSGPSLSKYLSEFGSLEQLREFCVHRSAYQLKEADPHSFALPRLKGEAKAAMMTIQFDEYGAGVAKDMHSTLFAETLGALGLDPSYGSYVEVLPGVTLATVNLVSMLALHRRWRGALVGHLAVFEMTSVEPMGRYSYALARWGIGPEGRRFYDVHVHVDAYHAEVARDQMVAGLIDAEPHLGADLLFGVAAVLVLEARFSSYLLDSWAAGRSSLVPWAMNEGLAGVRARSPVANTRAARAAIVAAACVVGDADSSVR